MAHGHRHGPASAYSLRHWYMGFCKYHWHQTFIFLTEMGLILSSDARIISIILQFLPFFNSQKQDDILYSTITIQLLLHFGHSKDITIEES